MSPVMAFNSWFSRPHLLHNGMAGVDRPSTEAYFMGFEKHIL